MVKDFLSLLLLCYSFELQVGSYNLYLYDDLDFKQKMIIQSYAFNDHTNFVKVSSVKWTDSRAQIAFEMKSLLQ